MVVSERTFTGALVVASTRMAAREYSPPMEWATKSTSVMPFSVCSQFRNRARCSPAVSMLPVEFTVMFSGSVTGQTPNEPKPVWSTTCPRPAIAGEVNTV